MNYLQIARLLGEISPGLAESRVQKVYQNEAHLLQLELYNSRETFWLTVRTGPGASGICLAEGRLGPSRHDHPEFCNKLRHDITGKFLVRIKQVENERVVELSFADGPGEGPVRILVLELFSNAANCFLLDPESLVLTLMHPSLSRKRGNFPGRAYTPPPEGRPAAAGAERDEIDSLMAERGLPDYNRAVRVWLDELAESGALERERTDALKNLLREQKRLARLAEAHKRTLEEAGRAGWNRECGEILAANYNSLRRGQEKVRLPDLYADPRGNMREIPLDPKLSPQDNLQRYFKRARKLESGAEYARARLGAVEARRGELERAMEQVRGLDTVDAMREVLSPLSLDRKRGSAGIKQREAEKRLPYREFATADGSVVLVGRKGKDNDRLTFRVARGRDLWLHVSGASGAHVVLRCERDGAFTEQALLDAAHLAVFYSDLKGQNSADVDYTACKHVSKPKEMPPGKVTMSERRTIHIRLETARLDRLLGRDRFTAPD